MEQVRRLVPYQLGGARLIRLAGGQSFSLHQDYDVRVIIPLNTNIECLTFIALNKLYHLPADGSFYIIDSRAPHFSINGHREFSRDHIVISTHHEVGGDYDEIYNWFASKSVEAPAPRNLAKVHPADVASLQHLHANSSSFFVNSH
jgi:hypothetical protein